MESESFNYLSVLLSIILGLAITQVLQGLRGLILTRAKIKLYSPTLIWAGLALLFAIQGWWASFGMRRHANWTFVASCHRAPGDQRVHDLRAGSAGCRRGGQS